MILFLLLAIHPLELSIEGYSGQEITIPITLVGTGNARIQTSEPIELDTYSEGKNIHKHVLTGRIHPDAQAGNYTSYLYVIEDTNEPYALANAIPIYTHVHARDTTTHFIEGTRAIGNTPVSLVLIASIVLGVLLVGFIAYKFKR